MNIVPCELPRDYVYNSVTDKSYKAVNETRGRNQAQDLCDQDGATLIEHRTVAEHEVLDEMFGKCTSNHKCFIHSRV